MLLPGSCVASDTVHELARNKTALMSSSPGGAIIDAARATDGDIDIRTLDKCAITLPEKQPWWRVDLQVSLTALGLQACNHWGALGPMQCVLT